MLFTVKAVFATVLQLNIYFILGQCFTGYFFAPFSLRNSRKAGRVTVADSGIANEEKIPGSVSAAALPGSVGTASLQGSVSTTFLPGSVSISIAAGFVLCHALFWILAYPWSLLELPFHILVIVWGILLALLLAASCLMRGKDIFSAYSRYARAAVRYLPYVIPVLLLGLCIVLIASRNHYLDIDSQTYIGEVTTIVGTNKIGSFDPTTGLTLSRQNFLKRGCSMFGAESAFWCRIFSIHPLLYCRYIRTALNPLLLLAGIFGVLRMAGTRTKQAFLYLMLACPAFLLFDNSGFTNTRFLMHRTYEGKAFLGGTLLFFTVLLCMVYIKQKTAASYALLFANELATLSVSATALYLIPPVLAAFLGAYILCSRKWKMFPLLLLLMLPNLAFAIVQFLG